MKMHVTLIFTTILLLTGCVTQPQAPVSLVDGSLSPNSGRIGVAMAPLPKVDMQFPGAGCLLCLATASMANSALTAHTQSLPYEDLPKLKNEIADLLRKRGTSAIVIPDEIKTDSLADTTAAVGSGIAKKNFSPFKQKYNIDKLLVIEINSIGMTRSYSAYISTSDPKATVQGTGYLVNLNDNKYEWYERINILKSADGQWDEPPKFPGLTNAYFQTIELAKDAFMKPLSSAATASAAR